MKNRILMFCLLLISFWAGAGTSVGNFGHRDQLEFDFRIMYASNWRLEASAGTRSTLREEWLLSNQSNQVLTEQASSIRAQFLLQFPAKDVKELLAEIQKLHPNEMWNPIHNPEIDGFYSSQKTIAPGRTKNLEYYFSKPGQVVQLETIRSDVANGAAEVEVTLSTIRRPSQAPKINSITMDKGSNDVYHPGDRACYYIEIDSMKADDSLNLNGFEIQGIPNYWSFQDVRWNGPKNRFEVCQNLTTALPEDGLRIQSFSISWGQSSLYCWGKSEVLSCQSSGPQKPIELKVSYPKFSNPTPDREGPHVVRFEKTETGALILKATDVSGVQIAKASFQFGKDSEKAIVFYSDELMESGGAKEVPRSLLYPGFNLISTIKLFDRLGNITVLTAVPGEKNYMITNNRGVESLSTIPLISVFGGGR
jgi:hypothetical protein